MKEENFYDVGIISFNLNTIFNNYGAALHSYAFQKYLSSLGISSVIIDYDRTSHFFRMKSVYDKNLKNLRIVFCATVKYLMFRSFFKKHCTVTRNKYNKQTIKNIDCAKRYCCETDVTWAPFLDSYDKAFMCDYPNMKNKNNIAYSVDIGAKELSDENKNLIKIYSKNFKYISIRDKYRLKDFKALINNNDVDMTIDPVFLLDRSEWDKIISKRTKRKKNFVFVYNCKEDNHIMVEQAKTFARNNNLDFIIVNCCDKKIKRSRTKIPTIMNIENFLWHIKNCTYFFTNSYHGICFSIIFQKEFFAYPRNGNNYKILNTLKLFELDNRFITETESELNLSTINYEKVNQKCSMLIEHSKKWLHNALELNNID